MAYFPMFVNLEMADCVIVGGGKVAFRKLKIMRDFGAKVAVVGEQICPEIFSAQREDSEGRIRLFQKKYNVADIEFADVVIAATDSEEINRSISLYCREHKIPVNVVDKPEDCTFIVPAYIKKQNLVAAFSSGGKSPVVTQYLKEKEGQIMTDFLGEVTEFLGEIRPIVKERVNGEAEKKRIYVTLLQQCLESNIIPSRDVVYKIIEKSVSDDLR